MSRHHSPRAGDSPDEADEPLELPTSAPAPAQTQIEFGVPETLTGWARRIKAYCAKHGISRSTRQVKNMAAKIAHRAESMQHVDPDDLIRYVLTYLDPTGEKATDKALEAEMGLAS